MVGVRMVESHCTLFSLIVDTSHILCIVESMKWYGVSPSVWLSQHGPTAANLQQQVCCCGCMLGRDISVGVCCSNGVRQANAGSTTLSAYIGS